MYQIKPLIKAGKPVFEVRRYASNFKSSVIIGETDTYEKACDALTTLQRLFPIITEHIVDPNQLQIPNTQSSHGKKS